MLAIAAFAPHITVLLTALAHFMREGRKVGPGRLHVGPGASVMCVLYGGLIHGGLVLVVYL